MMPPKHTPTPSPPLAEPVDLLAPMSDAVLKALSEALRGIRFGTVTVIIQDGRVVQIDRTERQRLKPPAE